MDKEELDVDWTAMDEFFCHMDSHLDELRIRELCLMLQTNELL